MQKNSQIDYHTDMCWKCKKSIDTTIPVYRSSVCSCGTDLHSCLNCLHYSPGSHYDCHETVDELVKDKDRANFCGWFSVKADFNGEKSGTDKPNDAKKAFNSLFGD